MILATKLWLLAAAVGTQSLLARMLGPEGRGAFAVCLLFGTTFGVLFTPASDRAAQYFVMSRRLSLSAGTWLGVFLSLAGSAVAIVVGIPLIQSSASFFKAAETSSFRIALLLVPIWVLVVLLQLQLAGLRRFARIGLFSVIQSTGNLLLIVFFVWYLGHGVNGAVLAQVCSAALIASLFFWDLRTHCNLSFELPKRKDYLPVVRYGLKYYVARIGSMIDLRLGTLFLAFLATPAEIGLFSAALAISLRVFAIPESIESSLLPRVAADERGRPKLVGQCARLAGAATAALLLILVAFALPIVRILLSAPFLPAISLIWIMAPGILLFSCSRILMTYFRGVNRPEVCSRAVWVGLLSNSLGLFALYPLIGLDAAAWGISLGFVARSIYLAVVFKRLSSQSYSETWSVRRADIQLMWDWGRRAFARLAPAISGRRS